MADKSPNTVADIAKFRMTLQMQNRKSSTIARKLASINSLFQYLMDLELVSSSPITKFPKPKVFQKIPSALLNEEVKKSIDALDSIQDKGYRSFIFDHKFKVIGKGILVDDKGHTIKELKPLKIEEETEDVIKVIRLLKSH
jgi:integrase